MKAKIIEVINETPYVKTFRLELENKITFLPGQFVTVIIKKEEKTIRRAYSISRWQKQPTKIITITLNETKNGTLSPVLFSSKLNDILEVEGPFGFFTLKKTSNPLLFLAAGTGITPLMTMMESSNNPNKTLLYSVRKEELIVFRKELESMDISFIPTLTDEIPDGWKGKTGRIDKEMLKENIRHGAEVYICGLQEFIKSMVILLEELNVPKENINIERW